jgi:uncharacterized protein (TIGR00661 family)
LDLFQKFDDQKFYIYGYDEDSQQRNCIFKKISTEGFLRDLASCRAVIGTAGFSLITECLYYKKKMLLLPVPQQYEQMINAHYIKKLNLGSIAFDFNELALKDFLDTLDKPLPADPAILWPDNNKSFNTIKSVLDNFNIKP